jgi:hypothetical protein
MLSEIFYSMLVTTSSGLLLAIIAACYKSKCRHIRLGCIEIERDVEAEEEIDIGEQEHKQ